jgi:UDP-N-acetylmuramate dehydrogenase
MTQELITELRKVVPVKLDEPMARHTTFGVGGPADIYVDARTEEQLRHAFVAANRHRVPVFIFGSGSNVLVGDLGIRGLVIENGYAEITGPSENGHGLRVRAGSGLSFSTLARRLAGAGYGGIEWACGIPGSMGGAIVSNAGAYGHSLRDVLISARLTDDQGEVREVTAGDLGLEYRKSAAEALAGSAVLSVDLRVVAGDPKVLKERIKHFDQQRRGAQPVGQNCGSVFKNPPGGKSAWQYVDEAGLRGHRIGNAQISELHSNFILNLGGATAADIRALVRLAQERVRETTGVELSPEVAFTGEFE